MLMYSVIHTFIQYLISSKVIVEMKQQKLPNSRFNMITYVELNYIPLLIVYKIRYDIMGLLLCYSQSHSVFNILSNILLSLGELINPNSSYL